MRGVYDAQVQIATVTAGKTLVYVTAPSTKCVEILSASISTQANTTNQQLEACLQRISTLGTPTATTLTPSPHETGDQAAASTVKGNVTGSEPTYGANTQIEKKCFSSLAGYEYCPLPEERPVITAGDTWGFRLLDSSLNSCTVDAKVTFREIG